MEYLSSLPWTLLVAAALFVTLLGGELIAADRPHRWRRWPGNLALGAVTLGLGRLLSMVAPLSAAIWAQSAGFGLFNWVSVPVLLAILLGVIAMDGLVWFQHRQFHEQGWLWRWHRLHHADTALDLSTGVRFHPIEAIVSLAWKSGCVAALGLPPVAVPVFEFWLMGGSLIEHSNIRLPASIDAALRAAFVTPAMHRVHHSSHGDDARHNYGFAISLWDHVFGTYRAEASGPEIGMPKSLI